MIAAMENNSTHMERVEKLIKEQGERDITLEASEGVQFVVSSRIAFQSNMILEALGDSENNHIQVPRINGDVLKAVVEFLTHHVTVEPMHEIPDTLEAKTFDEIISVEWYRNFVQKMDHDFLREVISAANYLLIKPLIDIACLSAAYELRGKSAEEIRERYDFPVLQPGEEERARQDLPWVFEDN